MHDDDDDDDDDGTDVFNYSTFQVHFVPHRRILQEMKPLEN